MRQSWRLSPGVAYRFNQKCLQSRTPQKHPYVFHLSTRTTRIDQRIIRRAREKGSGKFAICKWRFAIGKVMQFGVDKSEKVSVDLWFADHH